MEYTKLPITLFICVWWPLFTSRPAPPRLSPSRDSASTLATLMSRSFRRRPTPRFPRRVSLWQAPFARSKVVPCIAHNDIAAVHTSFSRCGPGTNARRVAPRTTAGSISTRNISSTPDRRRGEFETADVSTYLPPGDPALRLHLSEAAFLHHIDNETAVRSWSGCAGALARRTHSQHRPASCPNDDHRRLVGDARSRTTTRGRLPSARNARRDRRRSCSRPFALKKLGGRPVGRWCHFRGAPAPERTNRCPIAIAAVERRVCASRLCAAPLRARLDALPGGPPRWCSSTNGSH